MQRVSLDEGSSIIQLNIGTANELIDRIKLEFAIILNCVRDIIGQTAQIPIISMDLATVSYINIDKVNKLVQVYSLQQRVL